MKSMTGYGEAEAHGARAKIAVQVRTLNHRHLDIQLRVPREYLSIEEDFRKMIRQRISRGRVELFINRSALAQTQDRKLELDERLLRQYLRSLRSARKRFGLKGEVEISLLCSLPELFHVREGEPKEGEEKGLVLRMLGAALKNLEASREREGRQLKIDIERQVGQLKKISSRLHAETRKVARQAKESLIFAERGNSLETSPGEGETGVRIFKGDVNEELVRLESHVKELARLSRERVPTGKRIDFLLQEVQRELNTISSKAPQLEIVRLVLAGKESVEKIREQAQNIE
ncbi:MAG: YicC family protein [Deltaproteobacteria bacterium]|nr:YicC family protein [Deltaproteobacteria bacterium]